MSDNTIVYFHDEHVAAEQNIGPCIQKQSN